MSAHPTPDLPFEKAPPPVAPLGRRPIGYRGNLRHQKALYDPVYPTTKVPTSLIPRFPVDWRNGGRALLCAAMALLEGFRLHRHRQSLEWQRRGLCEGRCRSDCAKSSWRCLCAWRAVGIYKHYRAMDGLFISYKGFISTKKPLFTVPRFVAKQNGRNSVPLRWDPLMKTYTFLSPHLPLDERFEHADRHHFIRGFDTMKSFSGYTSDAVLTESDISESDTEDIS